VSADLDLGLWEIWDASGGSSQENKVTAAGEQVLCLQYWKLPCVEEKCPFFLSCSLQFDPAPRRGEPHVTRRTPDYFL